MALRTFEQITSFQLFQRQLNTFVGQVQAALPAYGTSLPAAEGEDGRLFVLMPGKVTYQLQSGAWVAI